MGKVRFRKTKTFGPVKVTLTPRGVGTSIGVRGARIGRGADGRTRISASIPGSGLSYQHTVGSGKKGAARQPRQPAPIQPRRGLPWWAWVLIVLVGGPLVLGFLGALF